MNSSSRESSFSIPCRPAAIMAAMARYGLDRKSTRLNSSLTEIYTLSLHDALPIFVRLVGVADELVFEGEFVLYPVQAGGDHGRDGQVRVHVPSGQPVLDPE